MNSKKHIIPIYNRWRFFYQVNFKLPYVNDKLIYKDNTDKSKGSEILDFGCENGDFLLLSKEISKRSVGVEITKENREYTNSIGIN